jgi:hypothetical protein
VPEDGDSRRHVLHLEEEAWQPGTIGGTTAPAARRREYPAQEAGHGNESDLEHGLCGGRAVRRTTLAGLTVVDHYTRESLAIDVGPSLQGEDVVDALNRIAT